MSVRFTSGGVGRFGFDEANATLDAADAMVGRFGDAGKPQRVEIPKPIVARLTQDLGDQTFELDPEGIKYRVWNWAQVQIGQGTTKKKIEISPQGKTSLKFGDPPLGQAVQLSGTSKVGDTIVLFKMMSTDGRPWFVFSGSVAAHNLMLEIVSSELNVQMSSGNKLVYTYQVEPRKIRYDGGVVIEPWTEMKKGYALNTYEISGAVDAWGHGQELEFQDLGELVPAAIEGYVTATLTDIGTGTDDATYIFEAANPMKPECDAGDTPTDAPSGILKRGL